jgi:hypothetical protein
MRISRDFQSWMRFRHRDQIGCSETPIRIVLNKISNIQSTKFLAPGKRQWFREKPNDKKNYESLLGSSASSHIREFHARKPFSWSNLRSSGESAKKTAAHPRRRDQIRTIYRTMKKNLSGARLSFHIALQKRHRWEQRTMKFPGTALVFGRLELKKIRVFFWKYDRVFLLSLFYFDSASQETVILGMTDKHRSRLLKDDARSKLTRPLFVKYVLPGQNWSDQDAGRKFIKT